MASGAYSYSRRAKLEPTRMADSVKPKKLPAAKSTEPKKGKRDA